MSANTTRAKAVTPGRSVPLVVAVALFVPALVLRFTVPEPSPVLGTLLFALGFVGAALLLTWGTELLQLDLPQGLAVAILALIAILPEYAVDLLFAYEAGSDPSKAPLALANMTGANRLLIGIGWSLVVLIAALGAARARRKATSPDRGPRYGLALSRLAAVDVVVLGAVSLYTLSFLFRTSLTLFDSVLLFAAFGFYAFRLWTAPKQEPEFIGPPAMIATLSTGPRRTVTIGLMLIGAAVILLIAEPFSSSLVTAGRQLGVDEFLMVQWIAPLATETAELIPACIFAFRQSADEGLGTLLSSKINQWTLLVGAVPVAYALAITGFAGLPIDSTQQVELFLTAAQSVFAVSLLIDLRLGVREALLILVLFLADFATSVTLSADLRPFAQYGFAGLYLLLAVIRITVSRQRLAGLLRDGLLISPAVLAERPGREAEGER